jgi:hypothetical protein
MGLKVKYTSLASNQIDGPLLDLQTPPSLDYPLLLDIYPLLLRFTLYGGIFYFQSTLLKDFPNLNWKSKKRRSISRNLALKKNKKHLHP